jgi:capsid assembly protease
MKHRLFDFYASKSWAILPDSLQEMYDIYRTAIDRKAIDVDFDPQAVSAKIGRPLDNARTVVVRDGVAILPVSGPIFRYANLFTEISGATSIEVLATDFRRALDDPTIQAIILEINSPGGEVDGTSELAQHVFNARGEKPVVAYASNLCCSAAFWLASGADEIVVADTASVGSIGVVGGVRLSKDKTVVEFVSSRAKNKRPDPQTESGRTIIQSHIDALEDVFVETVAANRSLSVDSVVINEGGVYVGQQAVDAGLADRVGTLEGLIAELSDSSKPYVSSRTQNLKQSSVVETSTDELPITGAKDMADKVGEDKKPVAVVDPPKTEAPPVLTILKADTSAELEAARKAQADTEAQLKAEKAASEQQAAQIKTLQDGMAALQKENREARFTQIAKDWSGDKKHHVSMLETLSQMEGGETSVLFTGYVTQQKATAEQLKESALFKELGSSGPAPDSAAAELEAKAKKMAGESAGKLTYQQAYDQIYASDAALRTRVNEEERRANN